jgi:hypothetical protein
LIKAVIALATPREKEMGALKAMKRKKRMKRINSMSKPGGPTF